MLYSCTTDPVCGTCRRKCRKCDRTKPQCRRCTSKGLVCEGYETKFKIYGVDSGPKRRQIAAAKALPKTPSVAEVPTDELVNDALAIDIAFLPESQILQDIATPPTFNPFKVRSPTHSDASASLLSPINCEEDEVSHLAGRKVLTKEDAQLLLAHCKAQNQNLEFPANLGSSQIRFIRHDCDFTRI